MPLATIEWNGSVEDGKIILIDQTKLPQKLEYIECKTTDEIVDAIKKLKVRGAPALGIAGAYGLVQAIQSSKAEKFDDLWLEINKAAKYIGSSRPTAVNLTWGIERVKRTARNAKDEPIKVIKEIMLTEAHDILEEDKRVCRAIGKAGDEIVPEGARILTHCNAGGLATADYGTALAVMFTAASQGKNIHVFADETRPLLQGARLTAWELLQAEIDVTLICDNTAGVLMNQGKVDLVITGADRIAANGDAANKVGTYSVAVLAKENNIPFYIAAPLSTFDLSTSSGKDIPIEERASEEVTTIGGRRIAPKDIKVYSPAFDVTPAEYIHGIITEKGIITEITTESIQAFFEKNS